MAAAKELVVGREVGTSIRFDPDRDDLVNRQHAKVQHDSSDPESLQLVDLRSRNGTFLARMGRSGLITTMWCNWGPGNRSFGWRWIRRQAEGHGRHGRHRWIPWGD
jgi:FHA domain